MPVAGRRMDPHPGVVLAMCLGIITPRTSVRDQATPGLSEQVAALTGMLVRLQLPLFQTPSIPHRTRGHVFALDDLPSVDGGRRASRSPRGAATAKPVSFCMAEATPPGT